jgi:hypothetical protein
MWSWIKPFIDFFQNSAGEAGLATLRLDWFSGLGDGLACTCLDALQRAAKTMTAPANKVPNIVNFDGWKRIQ